MNQPANRKYTIKIEGIIIFSKNKNYKKHENVKNTKENTY